VSYLARLSGRQRLRLAATLIVMIAVMGMGWLLEPKGDAAAAPSFSTDLTIRQIAPRIGTTGFGMAKELHLPRSVDKDTPLAELGIEQEQLDEVASHLLSHRGRAFKYYVFAALSLFGLVWLVRLGRPDGSPNSERKTWYPRTPYIAILLLAVVVCGFALGKSPNPMEGAVKIFKGMVGLQPSIAAVILAFIFFVGLAVVGNKLVCGWACPLSVRLRILVGRAGELRACPGQSRSLHRMRVLLVGLSSASGQAHRGRQGVRCRLLQLCPLPASLPGRSHQLRVCVGRFRRQG